MIIEPAFVTLFTLVTALIFILVGRLIVSHTTVRMMFQSPAMCLTTGLGMWYIWFLVFAVFLGTGIVIVWWLFIVVFLLLSLVMFKLFKSAPLATEHFWTLLVVGLGVVSPALLWLGQDAPQFTGEFADVFKPLSQIIHLGVLPNFKQTTLFAVDTLQAPLSAMVAVLPTYILANTFITAAFAVMNVVLLVAASGALLMASGVRVKWTNLPLCTAGALLGVTLLNPFFNGPFLTAALPGYVMALSVLLAFFPLLSPKPLPTGVSVLPIALTLTVLVGAHSFAWILVIFIVASWFLRKIIAWNRGFSFDIFGASLLVCLPLLAFFIWKLYLINSGIQPTLNWHFGGMPLAPDSLVHQSIAAGFVGLVILNGVWKMLHVRRYGGVRMLMLSQSWSLWPAALAIYIVVMYVYFAPNEPVEGLFRVFGWVQFIMLVPLWHGWHTFYKTSRLQKFAYKNPWLLGLILCGGVLGSIFMAKPFLLKDQSPVITHVSSVAKDIKAHKLLVFQQPLAVLDPMGASQSMMAYGLQSYVPVGVAPNIQTTRVIFHHTLREQKFEYVWVHVPTQQVNMLFDQDLQPTYSYLFKVTPRSFQLIKAFPHVAYDTY